MILRKLRFFYNTFYVPNNAVLVLVGDFKTSKVKSLIEDYYGKLPSRSLPERKYAVEPVQKIQQNATLKRDVQNVSFVVAFQSPKQGEPDMYALDLATNILAAMELPVVCTNVSSIKNNRQHRLMLITMR